MFVQCLYSPLNGDGLWAAADRRVRRAGWASRPSCCARGSRDTGSRGRFARRAASGSTPRPTPLAWSGCGEGSSRVSQPRRPHVLDDERPSDGLLEDAAARLLAAIGRYDEAAAHSVLDETLARFGLDETLRHVVLPTLKEVGDGWKRGEIEISQEHFASNLIRGRLLALARFWGRGQQALSLCSPVHPVSAPSPCSRSRSSCALTPGGSSFSARTRRSQRSPAQPRRQARRSSSSRASTPPCSKRRPPDLRRLARTVPLALAGPGATDKLSARLGARRLNGDLVAAANEVERT